MLMVETKFGAKAKKLRTNNLKEFLCGTSKVFIKSKGIVYVHPSTEGVVNRKHRHLVES